MHAAPHTSFQLVVTPKRSCMPAWQSIKHQPAPQFLFALTLEVLKQIVSDDLHPEDPSNRPDSV